MSFSKCPECGETNYYESGYSVRNFDCGFKGQWETRTARCGGKVHRAAAAITISDEAARYRLALLDAAQVTDTIAADMVVAGQSTDYVDRLRQLARQIRAFAGHVSPASFEDLSQPMNSRPTGTSLMTAIFSLRASKTGRLSICET